MKEATPAPAKDIWLHLLKAGEWMGSREIRESLSHLEFTNFPATLTDMALAGSVSVRKINGRRNVYAVTTASRVVRGLTLRELMAAMPSVEQQ